VNKSLGSKGCATPESLSLEWWSGLRERRGDRAELRRAAELVHVPLMPAYHELYGILSGTGWRNKEQLALVAGILSHVKSHQGDRSFAAQMALPRGGGGSARVSGLRFRRLIQIDGPADLYPRMIRVLRMLDGCANVESLAHDLYWWRSERTRREWAFQYYQTAPAAED